MEESKLICDNCGIVIETDDYEEINGQAVCYDCIENHTTICDCCGERIWNEDSNSDDYTTLCDYCYENHYTRCCHCNSIIHTDDAYHIDDYDYCRDCYDEECDNDEYIHEYSYKPSPQFYGDSDRYFGVELEIDGAGKDYEYAERLLDIANTRKEYIYIKSDSSLDDGMEIVSHPMTLEYHKNFCWEDVMHEAVYLGYRSHQTSTCGLHIHVNRNCFGDNRDEQDEIISRILYFVEHHWNELMKFSRRSEYSMNRWSARYGYEKSPKAILDKAKKGCNGRYSAVNLCNYNTIEFRLFRGTLKYNTFIATLELVNRICDIALYNDDEDIAKISWSDFVADITESELIRYLKERKLYINENVEETEEF